MTRKISILDAGSGNVGSLVRKLESLGAEVAIAREARDLRSASRLVLPGIGRFDVAMDKLNSCEFAEALHEAVTIRKVPVLGICLGLQLMAGGSEEGGGRGLGWIEGRSVRLRVADTRRYKVPHIGWNTVESTRNGLLLRGLDSDSTFYFSHSYHLNAMRPETVTGVSHYDYAFPSVIEQQHVFGTQFHPEKSHRPGDILLRNFLAT
jgi:glutamine amidotransferase